VVADPGVDDGDVEASLVADGELVIPGGHSTVAFEPVDAAFDGVTSSVVLGAEPGWTPSGSAAVLAVADLVGGLGDGRGDAASAR